MLDHDAKQKAVFTGDTLFIGDCGRPDLRERDGNIETTRDELARKMYHSLRDKLAILPDDVTVYPAHGAGTLCGKALSKAHSSTMEEERKTNWCLQEMTEDEFVEQLLADQPFVPAYFAYDLELNRKGAPAFNVSIDKVKLGGMVKSEDDAKGLNKDLWVVDARQESKFKEKHLPHSINLMDGEKFYLAGQSDEQVKSLIERTAAIGYEGRIEKAFTLNYGNQKTEKLDIDEFKEHEQDYTIVDVRNPTEVKEKKIFENSYGIPLAEIRNRVAEIPTDKPIVVHCASGYRSAAASSLIQSKLNGNTVVYDLGEAIENFI